MTPEEIDERVERIRRVGWDDPEDAHGQEDGLYIDALQAIASGAENPRDIAWRVLVVNQMDFPRWYA